MLFPIGLMWGRLYALIFTRWNVVDLVLGERISAEIKQADKEVSAQNILSTTMQN